MAIKLSTHITCKGFYYLGKITLSHFLACSFDWQELVSCYKENSNQISELEKPLLISEALHLVMLQKFEMKINSCWPILWWWDQIGAFQCFHCYKNKLLKYIYFYKCHIILQSSKRKHIAPGAYRVTITGSF